MGRGRIRSVRGCLFFKPISRRPRCPKRRTACPKSTMVLSAPAEPVFLVGVALGVLIAGAVFAINMRRWRAQQRLR